MANKPRKTKEQKIKTSDVLSEFREAIGDASFRSDLEAISRDREDVVTDDNMWLTTELLTFPEFCEHPDHMHFPPLSQKQKDLAEYMLGTDPRRTFEVKRNLAVLVWGKGGGKDTMSVLIQLYVVYLLLNLRNPQKYLALADQSSIDMYNIACAKDQAETVYFQILKTFVLQWSWLRQNWNLVINGRWFANQNDKEMDFLNKITITNDAIIFPKNIRCFSGSSESESLEGKNVLIYVLDEADAFKQNSQTRSADKIFSTMASSANSRFNGKEKGFIISWPRSKNGFIMKLYERTKNMLSVYGDIAPTWEVKPRHLFSKETFEFEGHQVPMDKYESFRLSPLESMACYLCEPPDAHSPFIEDYEKVDAATDNVRQLFEFKDVVEGEYVKKGIIRAPFLYDRSIRHVMTFDLSETRDYTALSIAHRENDKIIFDMITCWIPDRKKGVRVSFQNVEEVINNIRQDVTIDKIAGDPWNSAMLIQKLRGQGVKANIMKLDLEDYEVFKRLLYARQIVLPKNELLMKELKNLQLVDGRKVDHLKGMHNDLSVTVVMAVKALLQIDDKNQSASLMAEGEYVGDNLYEAVNPEDVIPLGKKEGLQIDGITIT